MPYCALWIVLRSLEGSLTPICHFCGRDANRSMTTAFAYIDAE